MIMNGPLRMVIKSKASTKVSRSLWSGFAANSLDRQNESRTKANIKSVELVFLKGSEPQKDVVELNAVHLPYQLGTTKSILFIAIRILHDVFSKDSLLKFKRLQIVSIENFPML